MKSTIQWIKNNPSKCMAPYTKMDIRALEDEIKITCCCNLDTRQATKLDYKFIDDVKKQLESGYLPPACHKCSTDEANNAQSERIKLLVGWPTDRLDNICSNNSVDFQVGTKFSNLCNLACRSCNPYDSSYWATVMNASAPSIITNDLSDDPEYWKSFTDAIRKKHKETPNFIVQPIGGETMIQPGFIKLLEFLIAEDLASTTTLRFTTSLVTNISKKFRELFLQFKKVVILASIDSVGGNYHYVRWPAQFTKIENNLQTVLEIKNQYPEKFDLSVSPVFSLNNIFYLTDIFDWWTNWATTNNFDLWMSVIYLHDPEYLKVENIAVEYRETLINILEQCVAHKLFTQHSNTVVLRHYVETMLESLKNLQTNPEDQFQKYLKYTAEYDKRTNTNSLELNSKLFGILSNDHLALYNEHKEAFRI